MRGVRNIKSKAATSGKWLLGHPVALLNVIGIVFAFGLFFFLMEKPIDVLKDWKIETTQTAVGKKLPVYHPNEVLQFTSKSEKLISAEGTSTRFFECDAIGKLTAREIQLDSIPANRPPGTNPPRENAIVVPDVLQFNGLPRICRLVINVCYDNVILWRDHCEQAKSNDFRVEESKLNPAKIQEQIENLKNQIKVSQKDLAAYDGEDTNAVANTDPEPTSSSPVASNTPESTNTPSTPQTPSNPAPTQPEEETPAPIPARPGLIERTVDSVRGLVNGILGS